MPFLSIINYLSLINAVKLVARGSLTLCTRKCGVKHYSVSQPCKFFFSSMFKFTLIPFGEYRSNLYIILCTYVTAIPVLCFTCTVFLLFSCT